MIQAIAPVPLRSPWHYLHVPGLLTQCHSVTVSRFNGVGSNNGRCPTTAVSDRQHSRGRRPANASNLDRTDRMERMKSPVANDAAPHHVYRSLQILKFIPQTGHLPA